MTARTSYRVTHYAVTALPNGVQIELGLIDHEPVAMRFTDPEGLSEFIAELKAARVRGWRVAKASTLVQVGGDA